jgi:hypothetical protein
MVQKAIYLSRAIHRSRNIYSRNLLSSLFIGGSTVMNMQNFSRFFIYWTKSRNPQTTAKTCQKGFVCVHGIDIFYAA